MKMRRGLAVLLGILCLAAFGGCRAFESKTPDLQVESKKSEIDTMIDKSVDKTALEDKTMAKETIPVTENVSVVTGEDATKSSEELEDPANADNTGAVAVKYEM